MAEAAASTPKTSHDFLIKKVATKANVAPLKELLAAFVGGNSVVYKSQGGAMLDVEEAVALRRMKEVTRNLLARGKLVVDDEDEPRIRACPVADGTLVDITFYLPGDDAVRMPFVLRYYHGRNTTTYHMAVGPESFDCRETFVQHVSNVLDRLHLDD